MLSLPPKMLVAQEDMTRQRRWCGNNIPEQRPGHRSLLDSDWLNAAVSDLQFATALLLSDSSYQQPLAHIKYVHFVLEQCGVTECDNASMCEVRTLQQTVTTSHTPEQRLKFESTTSLATLSVPGAA